MTTRIDLTEYNHFALIRERDSAGDSGMWLEAFDWDNPNAEHEQKILEIGKGVRCGSHYARTMQHQDWWLTTPVGEFLEVEQGCVKFQTENGSAYVMNYS